MKLGCLVAKGIEASQRIMPTVWKTETAWDRARGLLARPPLEWGQALWIEPCNNVHTVGMTYALDLAFLDAHGVIKKMVRDVKPLRAAAARGAKVTLEMRSGQLDRLALKVGDAVVWSAGP
jgi:uncharacterized membrane protein (UPF0127 family)